MALFFLCIIMAFPLSSAAQSINCSCDGIVSVKDGYEDVAHYLVTEPTFASSCSGLQGNLQGDWECKDIRLNYVAESETACANSSNQQLEEVFGFGTDSQYFDFSTACVYTKEGQEFNNFTETPTKLLPNPLGTATTPEDVIANVIRVVLGILGGITLLMFVYGGFMMLVSAGNADRVQQGKDTLLWATLGLIVIFGSYGIAEAIFKALGAS